jgi:hypothetical protein
MTMTEFFIQDFKNIYDLNLIYEIYIFLYEKEDMISKHHTFFWQCSMDHFMGPASHKPSH